MSESFVGEDLIKKKSEKKTDSKKPSPYKEFNNWLLNSAPQVMLPPDIIKAISPRAVLCMFGKYPNITIFLDEHFNQNWRLFSIKPEEFFLFIRQIVRKFGIKDLWNQYASEKQDKSLTEIHRFFPELKRSEVFNLLEYSKVDDDYDSFMDNLGLKEYKKTRIKKNGGKETKKSSEQKQLKENVEVTTFVTNIDTKKVTSMEDLMGFFK